MILTKTLFSSVAVFTFLFLLLLLASILPRRWNISSQVNNVRICISQIGIHTNIIVPIHNDIYNWQHFLNIKEIGKDPSGNYHYLGFGWGDRDFYPTNPRQIQQIVSLGLQALFFSRGSVMRVQGYQEIPQNNRIQCVGVNNSNYLNTVQFIQNSFQLTPQGQTILFVRSDESAASYYEAKGHYSILKNSNNWTAKGLKKANINTPLWAGIPQAVMFHVGRNRNQL